MKLTSLLHTVSVSDFLDVIEFLNYCKLEWMKFCIDWNVAFDPIIGPISKINGKNSRLFLQLYSSIIHPLFSYFPFFPTKKSIRFFLAIEEKKLIYFFRRFFSYQIFYLLFICFFFLLSSM
jgi:hypothetical protein